MATSTCLSPVCGITVDGALKQCPKCGWAMRNTAQMRLRGSVLLFCGLFLLGLMGYITVAMYPTLAYPERAIADGDFTGTPEDARNFLNLFYLVILFGALATVNAIYMLATGRQNKWFIIGTLIVAAVLGFATYGIISTGK